MGKTVKKTGLLLMICVLVFIFMFGAAGCSASYNEGYKKLYDFIKKNDISTEKGVIEYSKTVKDTLFNFTCADKSSGISVSVSESAYGKIEFSIKKEGLSYDNFLTVEVSTNQVGEYYYKGTTLIRSIDQTSFTFFNEKSSLSKYGGYTNMTSSSLISSLDDLLKLIIEGLVIQLCDLSENFIEIPIELFEGKKQSEATE